MWVVRMPHAPPLFAGEVAFHQASHEQRRSRAGVPGAVCLVDVARKVWEKAIL